MAIDTIGVNALATGSVTSAKIADGAVVAADVADGSVTTAKLAADAVTDAKLADNAVVSANISAGALEGTGVNLGRRNMIVNGDMRINQRAQTVTATGYTLDRFRIAKVNFDQLVIAITQDADNPSGNGFSRSLKLAVTTAETGTLASDEIMYLDTRFEGQNVQHLAYGTSSAKSLTLSFWVKSPLAGKHSVMFYNANGVRSNLQPYTVSSANTWEKKTITIAGDQTSGFAMDNSVQMILFWPLAGGSDYHGTPHTGWGAYSQTDDFMFSDQVNLAGQTGNFYLTGVQLEVGTQATDFEHRSFGEELLLCQRYYNQTAGISFFNYGGAGQVHCTFNHPVTMRATPTVTFYADQTNLNNRTNAGNCTKDGVGAVSVSLLNATATSNAAYVGSGQGTNHRVTRTMEAEL